jgi:hypothetical protein
MPTSKGIPPSSSPLASNMSEVISRKWLEPWPCMGRPQSSLTLFTRGQLSNPSRGPAFDPSRFIAGLKPIVHSPRNVRLQASLLAH